MSDKPWMRPMSYTDARQTDTSRGEIPLDGDTDPITLEPRERGSRDSVKPTGPSVDSTPMRYRKGDPDYVFGIDDRDENGEFYDETEQDREETESY